MRPRRIVAALLGAWLTGSIAMVVVATHNLRSVDSLLEGSTGPAAASVNALGRAQARMLLRYHAAELNRDYFSWWEWAQMGLGIATLGVLIGVRQNGQPWHVVLAIAVLLIVVAERFVLTPEIVNLGRSIDFVPPEIWSAQRAVFWNLHRLYSGIELVKMAAIAILAGSVFRGREHRRKLVAELGPDSLRQIQ
ncbi:MAG TPA: hypothetical protein VN428_13650 [Bryobacteraceae bacterium]|nr:hypothetical protein [Bryobacteraceae bacterium]